MLTDSELSQMRTDLEDVTLPDTCTIQSITLTGDGAGGWDETYTATASNVKCRLDQKSGMEAVAGGALQPFQSLTLSVPHDTTITTANRVIHNSIVYNVSDVKVGSWLSCKRVSLERVG